MTLNAEHYGTPIAMIMKKDEKSKSPLIISLDDSNQAKKSFNELTLSEPGQKFQVVGDPKRERDIIYISGRSGSGKSYFIKDYVNNYYKVIHKKRPVYLFSALKEDPTIDQIKGLLRIDLNSDFLADEEITVADFANSCVIFDDTDVLKNKLIRDKVNHILDEILQTGRHHEITCLITKHTTCNGPDTKIILAESHQFVLFINGLGNKTLKYLLDNYLGLDKDQIKKIKKTKGRWVAINRSTFPMSVVSEKECFVINNKDDDDDIIYF
jgi:hypothetical protein